MKKEDILEILDKLNFKEAVSSAVYREICSIETRGNPTSSFYDKLREFYEILNDDTKG